MSRRRRSRVKGQLTDGSRGSRVKKCDPLSSLLLGAQQQTTSPNRGDIVLVGVNVIFVNKDKKQPQLKEITISLTKNKNETKIMKTETMLKRENGKDD